MIVVTPDMVAHSASKRFVQRAIVQMEDAALFKMVDLTVIARELTIVEIDAPIQYVYLTSVSMGDTVMSMKAVHIATVLQTSVAIGKKIKSQNFSWLVL